MLQKASKMKSIFLLYFVPFLKGKKNIFLTLLEKEIYLE